MPFWLPENRFTDGAVVVAVNNGNVAPKLIDITEYNEVITRTWYLIVNLINYLNINNYWLIILRKNRI